MSHKKRVIKGISQRRKNDWPLIANFIDSLVDNQSSGSKTEDQLPEEPEDATMVFISDMIGFQQCNDFFGNLGLPEIQSKTNSFGYVAGISIGRG